MNLSILDCYVDRISSRDVLCFYLTTICTLAVRRRSGWTGFQTSRRGLQSDGDCDIIHDDLILKMMYNVLKGFDRCNLFYVTRVGRRVNSFRC